MKTPTHTTRDAQEEEKVEIVVVNEVVKSEEEKVEQQSLPRSLRYELAEDLEYEEGDGSA